MSQQWGTPLDEENCAEFLKEGQNGWEYAARHLSFVSQGRRIKYGFKNTFRY
jgi:hypothetical protein